MLKTIYSKEHKYLTQKIRVARLEAGLTQRQSARLIRKSQSYISKIESSQRRIDIVQLKTFARIYKKKLGFFL